MQTNTLQKTVSQGLKKARQQTENDRRRTVQQTVRGGGAKAVYTALNTAQKAQFAQELEDYYRKSQQKSGDLAKQTAARKSNIRSNTSIHYTGEHAFGGSSGSFGEASLYAQRRQQKDEARETIRERWLDTLGTAATQAELSSMGYVSPDLQLSLSRRQADNAQAIREARKRLQKLNSEEYIAPGYDDLTTAQKAVDRMLGDRTQITGEKTDWGNLLQGVFYKGSDAYMTNLTNTVDLLFGGFSEELHLLGVESINAAVDMMNAVPGVDLQYVNPVEEGSFLRRGAQRFRDFSLQNQEYFASNANSSRAAQIVDRFGTPTVAAIPFALEAAFLGLGRPAAEMTTEGLNYISSVSQSAPLRAVSQMTAEGLRKLFGNPQYWTSYIQSAGNSYRNALDDGISEEDAALYALINGGINAVIEVGGADETLGGINRLPERLKRAVERGDKHFILQWAKTVFDEGREEALQGIMERGLKAFTGKHVPIVSFDPDDRDAIFNPYSSAEEFVGGAVPSAILGGVQSALAYSGSTRRQANTGVAKTAVQQEAVDEYLRILEKNGILPPESGERTALEYSEEGSSFIEKDLAAEAGPMYDLGSDEANIAAYERDHPIRQKIKQSFPHTMDTGQQRKHVPGTLEYEQYAEKLKKKGQYGPSRIEIDSRTLQALIQRYAGTGILEQNRDGSWKKTEIITVNDLVVGTVVNNFTGKEVKTTVFKIHWSENDGWHIVPDYPNKKGRKGKQ